MVLDTGTYDYTAGSPSGPLAAGLKNVVCFPAPAGLTNMPPGTRPYVPQKVLTGLVGPFDANGTISVFQYLQSTTNTVTTNFDSNTAQGATNELDLQLFNAVIANLEIMTRDSRGKMLVQVIRTAMYLRNNAAATLIGRPTG